MGGYRYFSFTFVLDVTLHSSHISRCAAEDWVEVLKNGAPSWAEISENGPKGQAGVHKDQVEVFESGHEYRAEISESGAKCQAEVHKDQLEVSESRHEDRVEVPKNKFADVMDEGKNASPFVILST